MAVLAYLALTLILFSGLMGQRLWASANGRTVDMALQGAGSLDWGEPFLRDPLPPAMWGLSAVMVLFSLPAVGALVWLVKRVPFNPAGVFRQTTP